MQTPVVPLVYRRQERLLSPSFLVLAAAFLALASPPRLSAGWVAVNDQQKGPKSSANATFYAPPGLGVASGPLSNVVNGALLPVVLTLTNLGSVAGAATMGSPSPGTPAYGLFSGLIDWQSGPGTNNGVHLYGTNVFGYTFTGLDTNKVYRFVATAARGGAPSSGANADSGAAGYFSNRWTLAELVGVVSATAAHSPNVITQARFPADLRGTQAAFCSGANTNTGDVVQWDRIVPGPAGSFTVLCRKYSGHFPGGGLAAANYAYAFSAIRLEEVDPAGYAAILSPPNDSTLIGPASLAISAVLSAPANPTNVQFYVDSWLVGSVASPPYSISWNRPPPARYQLKVVGRGQAGSFTSAPVSVLVSPSNPVSWVAFNDQQKGAKSKPNDTFYAPPGLGSTNTGPLADIRTGLSLPVTLLLTNSPGVDKASTMAEPLPGTPAHTCFYDYIDFADANTGMPGVHLYSSNTVGYVFTGLATNMYYRFTATAVRGGAPGAGAPNYYSNRWTQAELLGAVSFSPAHSAGVITSNVVPQSLTNSQAAFHAGGNLDEGDIVQWERVVPASDGSFTVLCRVYQGYAPDGFFIDATESYAFSAVRLEQYAIPPSVVLTTPASQSVFYSPTDITLGAIASSPYGITNVRFYANGVLLGQTTTSPCQMVWTNPPVGLAQLTAAAVDSLGLATTSAVTQIAIDVPPADSAPPVILDRFPATYLVSNALTSVEVTFSRLVQGVQAADLLVNGVPAAGLSGSGSNYTFTFPPPPFGAVAIAWDSGHGITDLAPSPHPFDGTAPGATWQYLTVDAAPPVVSVLDPPAWVTVRSLDRLAVTFSKPVVGVRAADLLLNGQPAQHVTGSGTGPYSFSFTPPATGLVRLAWAPDNLIQDTASPPNSFVGESWACLLDPAILAPVAVSHVIHISVDGLGAVYLQACLSNAPSAFPNFARLRNQGASTFNARTDNDNTVTIPNHACMLTGRPVLQPAGQGNVQHGYSGDFPTAAENLQLFGNNGSVYKASPFDVVHDRGFSTGLLASKAKFVFYVNSWDAVNGAPDLTGDDNGRNKIDSFVLTEGSTNLYGASEALIDALLSRLTNAPWTYTFLHFADPDYAGHSKGWNSPTWSNAVRHVDQQLGRILAVLDTEPTLTNQFAIVLTADHGGYATSHSAIAQLKNYTVPIIMWGPPISQGADLYDLFANRLDPGTNRIDYDASSQPLRNGDTGNLALSLLGLPPIPGSLMVPVFGSLPASLGVAWNGPVLTVTWPTRLHGYQLESASAMASSPAWQPVTAGIVTNGGVITYQTLAPAGLPTEFYRLRKP